jgi:hypothetical protein
VRYFFHVSDHTTYKDEVGRSFSNVEIAKAHATVIARELAIWPRTMLAIWSA